MTVLKHPMKEIMEIPLSELDKMFYCFDLLGATPMQRRHFELQGGRVDINILRKACSLELIRHPLLNSLLNDRSAGLKWKLCWVPRKTRETDTLIREEDLSSISLKQAEDKFQQIRFDPFKDFDLKKHPPFLIVLLKFPDNNYRLLTFFHHAAVDGTGYLLFLKKLFQTYNTLAAGTPVKETDYHPPASAEPPLLPTSFIDILKGITSTIYYIVKESLRTRKTGAAKLMKHKGPFAGEITAAQRSFSPDKMKAYLSVSHKKGTTLNIFFVAALAKSFEVWGKTRKEDFKTVYIQVLHNLRKKDIHLGCIANRFVSTLFYTTENDLESTKHIIESTKKQSESLKRRSLCEKMICLLWPLNFALAKTCLPIWGNFFFNNPKVLGTLVVSNMGRLWTDKAGNTEITHLGDSEITAIYNAGFPIPSIGNFITLTTYKKTLFLTLNYYTWCMSKEEAESFLDCLEVTLDSFADQEQMD